MTTLLRDQWREVRLRKSALNPEERYGKPAHVRGSLGPNCMVHYNRDTDTLIFVPLKPSSYDPDHLVPSDLVPEGGLQYVKSPGKVFGPTGLGNGAVLEIQNGEIWPGEGGIAPTSPTMFNPLHIEALERLADTFPQVRRWRLLESRPSSYPGARHNATTVRSWLSQVNDLRAEYAQGHLAKIAFQNLVLYHGTISFWADQIHQQGLTPRNQTGVENHWQGDNERWKSREGMVYLSHPGRLTITRSAMEKARDPLVDKWYGAEKKAIDDEWRDLSNRFWGADTPEKKAAYEDFHKRARELEDRIRTDPRLQPVLLQITIPREGWKNLQPDEDTEEYSNAVADMTGMPPWMASIGSDSVVAYRGTIPPSWIREIMRGPDALRPGMSGDQGTWWKV